jgi:hypothetical protein
MFEGYLNGSVGSGKLGDRRNKMNKKIVLLLLLLMAMVTSLSSAKKKAIKENVKATVKESGPEASNGTFSSREKTSRRYNIISLALGGNLPLGELRDLGLSYGFSTRIGYEFKVFDRFAFPKLNKYRYLLPSAKVEIGLNWLLSSDASLKGYDFLVGPAWRHQIAKSKFNIRSSILVGQYIGKVKSFDLEDTHKDITFHIAAGGEYQLNPEISLFIDNRYEYIHSSLLEIQNYNFSIGANYAF